MSIFEPPQKKKRIPNKGTPLNSTLDDALSTYIIIQKLKNCFFDIIYYDLWFIHHFTCLLDIYCTLRSIYDFSENNQLLT